MTAPLAYERFSGAAREEYLMRIGPRDAAPVLIVPPLYEEMNRTRALIVAVMRGLAAAGLAAWLPDLGGTGESEGALETTQWGDWRHDVTAAAAAVARAAGRPAMVASLRGGALIDDAVAEAAGHWRFAPAAGASLARDMDRAALGGGVAWAGYRPADAMKAALAAAVIAPVAPLRTVRLSTDVSPADAKVDGPALWRRSEPGTSPALAAALAADLAAWSAACAG